MTAILPLPLPPAPWRERGQPTDREFSQSGENRCDGAENRIVLAGVSWETYLALRDAKENDAIRMTYDEGRLELVSPSSLHERITWLWGRFVVVWTEEWNLPIDSRRSTTFRPQQRQQGFEADDCFYIQNEPAVRAKDRLDLSVDPPPDLGLEVDITSPSIPRLPIYAAIRVPEVWIWGDDQIRVLRLQEDGTYSEVTGSVCLPGFPFDVVLQLLDQRFDVDSNSLMRKFREWIRQHRTENGAGPGS